MLLANILMNKSNPLEASKCNTYRTYYQSMRIRQKLNSLHNSSSSEGQSNEFVMGVRFYRIICNDIEIVDFTITL